MNDHMEHGNLRTLASLLNISESEAAPLLASRIQITWSTADDSAKALGEFIIAMLERTFETIGSPANPDIEATYELSINGAAFYSVKAMKIYAELDAREFYCGRISNRRRKDQTTPPPILSLLCACFASAQIAHYALGLPSGRVSTNGVEVDFCVWPGVPHSMWQRDTNIGNCQLAGAGAVSNAILYALQYLPIRGSISIIDPKPVTHGIINRCLWFDLDDVNHSKAVILAEKANAAFKNVNFTPYESTVQKARAQLGELACLIVGVDSRGARRKLQSEIPLEVFDASTTGVEEVVFHHNRLLTGHACLACIYSETDAERNHTSHVADMLNVTNEDLAEGYITENSARKIIARYPELKLADLNGIAFDSLFRQLCATQQLITPEQKQVLAPFSFVSQLAGTVQAIELFLRRQSAERCDHFNYWRVNPWRGVIAGLQQMRPKKVDCIVCSETQYIDLSKAIWGK